ncbi:Hypothetical protein PROPAUS_0813 [Propionibacterium australiense]|uniref:Uncharacterized protein n=1 Tax=Propionibacterium australiense TaxID=119981 RepID=A0A383S5R2_9ACTN|nr:Hypothetical protein PROPAUS_0813 [Propionibacterium australiense]
MTVTSLRDDFLIMAAFMLIGFFAREKIKILQKLYLPASLIGGLMAHPNRGCRSWGLNPPVSRRLRVM